MSLPKLEQRLLGVVGGPSAGKPAVLITRRAEQILQALPPKGIEGVVSALERWGRTVPLRAARVRTVVDPEDLDWEEVVFELLLEARDEEALALWDPLGSAMDRELAHLSESERVLIDQHVGVHLLWGLDFWACGADGAGI